MFDSATRWLSSSSCRPRPRGGLGRDAPLRPRPLRAVLLTGVVARTVLLTGVVASASLACGSGEVQLPEPRGLVIYTGERLAPPRDRMEVVDDWIREQWDSIQADPSFMIYTEGVEGPVYPWESLEVNEAGDTARISVQGRSAGSQLYTIYAHYHLMAIQERLDKWLPEGLDAQGGELDDFGLEKAILSRVADVWLYQRSILDAPPYGLLDELTYAKENGYLDEFILTARPDAFVEARREYFADNPDRASKYLDWFRSAFERDPPGLRGSSQQGRGSPQQD